MFAGSFYPGSDSEIRHMLDLIIRQADRQARKPHPPIMIIPHAGWQYSGLAAVKGLLTLVEAPPKRIVLIGPAHRHYFMGFSPAGYEKYETPLGEIQVDLSLQQDIVAATDFEFVPDAHKPEHSLEVILPMLQHIVPGDWKILPILAGSVARSSINKLADTLAASLDPFKDVVIISSDLSHFFSYERARELDSETLNFILEGDSDSIIDRSGEGGKLACGFAGIVVAINLARKWGLGKPEVLIYYNSGDSGGDHNSVVGYTAIEYPPADLTGLKKPNGEQD